MRDAPQEADSLGGLGTALTFRFEALGDLHDLHRAVSNLTDAVHLAPDSNSEKSGWMNNLSISLFARFEWLGDEKDLAEALVMGENAVRLTKYGDLPNQQRVWANLGGHIHHRFHRFGDMGDLNRSVLMLEDVIHLAPHNDPSRPRWFSNLAAALTGRFWRLGDVADLKKSVAMAEEAVRLTPHSDPDWLKCRHNLAVCLSIRFSRFGDLDDLNQCIFWQEETVQGTLDGNPAKLHRLRSLGESLLSRFDHLGDLGDLSRSALVMEDAIRLAPDSHVEKVIYITILSHSLLTRFERVGDIADLNRSVELFRHVVKVAPNGSPKKPLYLSGLAVALGIRFQTFWDLEDINEAVLVGEEAVHRISDDDPQRPVICSHLGQSLAARFRCLKNLNDLIRSILMHKVAVESTPDDDPEAPTRWLRLGFSVQARFKHLGDPADLHHAVSHFQSAAKSSTGPAHVRLRAAFMWAECVTHTGTESPLDAYHMALRLLPEAAWLGLSISDRHHEILHAGLIVRHAATAAIVASQPKIAVEWLEQGRAVIWGQLLALRTPVNQLNDDHPKLAERLLSLSSQLEGSGMRRAQESNTNPSHQLISDQAHRAAHARKELLQEIRHLKGFEQFLLPKTVSQLALAAQRGPVVMLNISTTRCDALVLMAGLDDDVLHIPLPNFTPQKAEHMAKSFRDLVHPPGRNERMVITREGKLTRENEFAKTLSELWVGLVKPVLDGLAITTPTRTDLPHIWWCPTGPLAFLPIHAAGLYDGDKVFGSKLSDFVISSYAPSLAAIINGFRATSESQPALEILAISQPSAEGQTYIPGTQEEITCIKRLADGKVPVRQLDQDLATIDCVEQGMRECRWVHFACHGIQHATEPTDSALLLAKSSRLTLSNIIKLALPYADLAFLSACHTATGDRSLEEESVHLAAGMLSAGYRGVIATMWSIMDNDAPQVANDVYENLFKTSPPDPTRAAEALHLAIRKLQEGAGQKSFFHWVPFIHVGV
ncbi:CHAT domain-containing protein [Mycena leptocephala]|nr:CHAT domain-containing protein [Mycena leptocephala]